MSLPFATSGISSEIIRSKESQTYGFSFGVDKGEPIQQRYSKAKKKHGSLKQIEFLFAVELTDVPPIIYEKP